MTLSSYNHRVTLCCLTFEQKNLLKKSKKLFNLKLFYFVTKGKIMPKKYLKMLGKMPCFISFKNTGI